MPASLDEAHARIAELENRLARERARRESAENNERCFRELAEHIREVFWMTDSLGVELVYISPAYESIWGQTCESLYENPGKRLAWVHDDDRERVLKAFKRDAPEGAYDQTFRITRPDGGIRWIRDRAYPVHDDDGKLYRLAGFALDVTDRIKDNDRLNRLHMDIDANDRMSAFAALGTGLAHDLGQPLTAARNYIASVQCALGHRHKDWGDALDKAHHQIERAIETVRHLRDFAREGKPTLETQPLSPLLDEIARLLDPALRARQIRYQGPTGRDIQAIELPLDRVFAQQILRNLVSNAIEALDDADTPRYVRTSIERKRDTIEISVEDNGSGVEGDSDPFVPFRTTKDNGLGLGLAVSRSLARSHGGDLVIGSRGRASGEDRTRFVLSLPRGEPADQ